ncbi:MAG: bifunctional DNA-formamidopyrimidine glycosylase/DNA-(apurinic or apyrimidinic site) lyase [Sulfobacillus acidophilus]|uniref:Formamidopyrimidine-DNA glycosylase n=1 Tax=Sulfobacillus acidophilus TaxID=53633 RepID=A0A2T2WDX6_9FIRM|nr:MAG: bifunctional DNA-formamidopyrimidine glycosylase/DNA-(apurinic or apyrimidinic site) lyase [Sulfobacillus acidophilus]
MPELPEVETIRRYLNASLPHWQVQAVVHLDERMVKHSPVGPEEIRDRLTGATFTRVERMGKFLLLSMSTNGALLLHLGMSGRLVLEDSVVPRQRHTHLVLDLGSRELRLVDPRRFGRIAWATRPYSQSLHLGVDPLSRRFSGQVLYQLLAGRTTAIKTALLNQQLVAGIGNIYADEALYAARIHPARVAGHLTREEVDRLARAIRKVLRVSLAHRGTSFSDYVDALGHPGANQYYLNVYGREQLACRRCKNLIQREVLGGRSSHFCPRCQPQLPPAVTTMVEQGARHAEI